eukprot:scaffold2746_cov394-Pavlova_lutheri.AAC.1
MEIVEEVEHFTPLGIKLKKSALKSIDNAIKKLKMVCTNDEYLDVIVLFSKDGRSEHVPCSRDLDTIPIANYWRDEGGHMVRECRKRAREIRIRRTRVASGCRLSVDQQCIAVRICQRAITNSIPGKSKSLSFRQCGTSREAQINKQTSHLSKSAPWWAFDVYGWKSMTRPSAKQKADASTQLDIFMQNMSTPQVQDVLSISQAWGEIEIFEYFSDKLNDRSGDAADEPTDRTYS